MNLVCRILLPVKSVIVGCQWATWEGGWGGRPYLCVFPDIRGAPLPPKLSLGLSRGLVVPGLSVRLPVPFVPPPSWLQSFPQAASFPSALPLNPSLPAGLHSHALGLPWRPPGGGETPAKPGGRHQHERQGEAVLSVHIGVHREDGGSQCQTSSSGGQVKDQLVSRVVAEKLQALQEAWQ